ncbi:uncharacterized protein LOC128261535 [Drosophila gunungcola]|uniref:uncharacterized protein LOC128261535 n=1 Tax=Drosophila gunungcola TaxID=103775 RepID=UPI0022E2906B|nr:uncharacterized protein LOC128261535 [Drosophila gunungcola]
MKNYIVFVGLLLISHRSLCFNEKQQSIINEYGKMIEAKELELQTLESRKTDLLRQLEDIKSKNVDILESDRLRTSLQEKVEQLRDCESNLKIQEGSSAFWSTVKEVMQSKPEEKLKTFESENVIPNISTWDNFKNSTWDTIKNNWKDIPRQIVIFFTENEKP